MPKVLILQAARDDLARLEDFLEEKNLDAACRMKDVILKSLRILEKSPNLGSQFGRFKRLIIRFGKSKYVIIYNYLPADDTVYVISMRHSREFSG
ncbi:hypothetical protein C4J81_18945 (plasmid) [Deltaproteobacteria bacterium Smac51]|nr:hypothetical protein C4J81_18945 [Deltaproteobacteria bacterium Smac51]